MNCTRILGICLGLVVLAPPSAQAATINMSDTVFADINVLLQPRFDVTQQPEVGSTAMNFSPYMRRMRLAISGQVGPWVTFFAQTDSPNFGLNSNWSPVLYMQDAFLEFNIDPALQVDAGVFFLPFSHQGTQGGQRLLGVDYGTLLILEPPAPMAAGATSTVVWRDVGLMLRGRFWEDHFEYRAAITGGLQKNSDSLLHLNPEGVPRLTGRLVFNVFQPEGDPGATGVFYAGVRLEADGDRLISPKQILSVAASATWQPGVVAQAAGGYSDFQAYSADVYWDLPVGDATQAVTGQVDFYYYNEGATGAATGRGIFAEAGYRIDRWEPLAAVEWYATTRANGVGSSLYYRVGVNYWLYGHSANIKLDVGVTETRVKASTLTAGPDYSMGLFKGRLQAQVLF